MSQIQDIEWLKTQRRFASHAQRTAVGWGKDRAAEKFESDRAVLDAQIESAIAKVNLESYPGNLGRGSAS